MPELSAAPSDTAVTGFEKLLTLEFQNITVQQVADANESKSADIASATTTDLSTATTPYVHVTGTTTITGLGTAAAGAERVVVFDGVLLLTHNGTSLILPTGANITTAAGDAAIFRSEGSGNWRCVVYQRKDGSSLAGGGGGSAAWGSITGTLSAQTDLQAALDAKSGTTVSIITEASTSTMDPATHAGLSRYIRCADDVTFNTSESYAAGEVYNIRATASLTLIGTGVTLTPPAGGTLDLDAAMSVTVVMTSSSAGDVIGQTVPV